MPVNIKIAKDPKMLDDIFKVRYQVFSEEEQLFKTNESERVIDRFDAYPTCANLAVVCNDEVVGSLRMTLDSNVGLPADEPYDFRQTVPEDA